MCSCDAVREKTAENMKFTGNNVLKSKIGSQVQMAIYQKPLINIGLNFTYFFGAPFVPIFAESHLSGS